jgi:hypothetical protein
VCVLLADKHLAILCVNVGTHVHELVNDADQAALCRDVKRSAAILRWQSAGGSRKVQWQECSIDWRKITCGRVAFLRTPIGYGERRGRRMHFMPYLLRAGMCGEGCSVAGLSMRA